MGPWYLRPLVTASTDPKTGLIPTCVRSYHAELDRRSNGMSIGPIIYGDQPEKWDLSYPSFQVDSISSEPTQIHQLPMTSYS